MNSDEEFLAAISMSNGIETHMVYADWLEERGDSRSEYLRTLIELSQLSRASDEFQTNVAKLRKLHRGISADWRKAVSLSTVVNCDVSKAVDGLFDFECPLYWHELSETNDQDVRFCDGCKQHVFLCKSIDAAQTLGGVRGACVAVELSAKESSLGRPNTRIMGRVMPPKAERDLMEKSRQYPSTAVRLPNSQKKQF